MCVIGHARVRHDPRDDRRDVYRRDEDEMLHVLFHIPTPLCLQSKSGIAIDLASLRSGTKMDHLRQQCGCPDQAKSRTTPSPAKASCLALVLSRPSRSQHGATSAFILPRCRQQSQRLECRNLQVYLLYSMPPSLLPVEHIHQTHKLRRATALDTLRHC